jgi:hypothetical protein
LFQQGSLVIVGIVDEGQKTGVVVLDPFKQAVGMTVLVHQLTFKLFFVRVGMENQIPKEPQLISETMILISNILSLLLILCPFVKLFNQTIKLWFNPAINP